MDHIVREEILERLPTKSLCRFKSVSKQWKSEIESSYFNKKHLIRFPNPKLVFLQSEKSKDDQNSATMFLADISEDDSKDKIFICSYKLPDRHSEFYKGHTGRVIGYCDALACIYHLGDIYIINPTIRKVRLLSPEFFQNYTFLSDRSKSPINVGFGRDIITGEYKVVLMYLYDRIASEPLVKTYFFNLNNGERTCIYFPYADNQFNIYKIPTCANGSLYWLKHDKPTIAALDLHTELFNEVLPPSWYTGYCSVRHLWSLKDRLCINDVRQNTNVDIWVLQQDNSWEKFFSGTTLDMYCFDRVYYKYFMTISYTQVGRTAFCTKDLVALTS